MLQAVEREPCRDPFYDWSFPSPLQPNAALSRKYQSGEGAGGEAE